MEHLGWLSGDVVQGFPGQVGDLSPASQKHHGHLVHIAAERQAVLGQPGQ